jgi:sec-independent protein translocase protein TatA
MNPTIPVLAIGPLGTPEIIMILFVVLLLFGAKRLPDLARSFGKSMREFKKAASEVEDNFRTAIDEEDRKKMSEEEIRRKMVDEEVRRRLGTENAPAVDKKV